jgi:hypothetical protein
MVRLVCQNHKRLVELVLVDGLILMTTDMRDVTA